MLFAVYHEIHGYYNFGKGCFDNMHEYNFNIEMYATNSQITCNILAAEYKAHVIQL